MKLRAVTLNDVRQFTTPVRVSGLSEGLNVLSAPNESGKSTLFDAIYALFFIPHRSRLIAPLKPSTGGNPEITVEIGHEGQDYRLHKRWGRGALAEVWQGARLIAKGDAAEDWITALTAAPEAGGPAGLLWVRQGLVALDDGSRKDLENAHKARRDLISSITGEFEALTGGKRMDRALARAREDLGQLITQRGARAGGPLKTAEQALADLEARATELTERATRLRASLEARRRAQRQLRDLTDPEEIRLRAERVKTARAALDAAQRHADAIATAEARVQAAQLALDSAEAALARRQRLAQDLEAAKDAQDQTRQRAEQAEAALKTAEQAGTDAREAAQQAQTASRAAETAWQAALRAAAGRAAVAQRAELTRRLAEARTLAAPLPALRKAATTGPDAPTLARLEEAEQARALAQALAEAAAPHLRLSYASADAPRVTVGGTPLAPDHPVPLPREATLALPGIGTLTVTPAEGGAGDDRLQRAQDALAQLCAAVGVADLAAARAATSRRAEAAQQAQAAVAALRHLAPDGIEALEQALAALPDPAPDTGQDADPGALDRAAQAARTAATQADARLAAARDTWQAARETGIRAQHALETATRTCAEIEAQLAAQPPDETLAATHREARDTHDRQRADHARLTAAAPDLATCRAALDRAEAVQHRADTEAAQLREGLARLEAGIEADAGSGVDEDLAEVTARCISARQRLAAVQREVAVLERLIAALEAAQAAARDRYFAPLLAELRPMLHLLWPGAELHFDGDLLLPDTLVRDGQAEPIGTLSGGTREQIALLVRLAFARLLAKSGRHAPVILDDALVYTDDDRIEQMFDALSTQAQDLQILVLSCRNRALRALGGTTLAFEPA